jgi:hypothetical protein
LATASVALSCPGARTGGSSATTSWVKIADEIARATAVSNRRAAWFHH